ncbi:hypothetical protein HK102_011729, partial [Quaeritorhiza haematococci]
QNTTTTTASPPLPSSFPSLSTLLLITSSTLLGSLTLYYYARFTGLGSYGEKYRLVKEWNREALLRQKEKEKGEGVQMYLYYQGVHFFGIVAEFLKPYLAITPKWHLYPSPTLKQQMFDIVAVGSPGRLTLFVGDPDLAKQITANRHDYPKPTEDYKILDVFGPNIVTTDGEDWRRFRRIAAPQFSEKNNKLVHDETVHTMHDLFRLWDRASSKTSETSKPEFEVNFSHICTAIALHVFSAAGYGKRLTWEEEHGSNIQKVEGENSKHVMGFQQAMHGTVEYLLPYLILPKWVYLLPIPFVQRVNSHIT